MQYYLQLLVRKHMQLYQYAYSIFTILRWKEKLILIFGRTKIMVCDFKQEFSFYKKSIQDISYKKQQIQIENNDDQENDEYNINVMFQKM